MFLARRSAGEACHLGLKSTAEHGGHKGLRLAAMGGPGQIELVVVLEVSRKKG